MKKILTIVLLFSLSIVNFSKIIKKNIKLVKPVVVNIEYKEDEKKYFKDEIEYIVDDSDFTEFKIKDIDYAFEMAQSIEFLDFGVGVQHYPKIQGAGENSYPIYAMAKVDISSNHKNPYFVTKLGRALNIKNKDGESNSSEGTMFYGGGFGWDINFIRTELLYIKSEINSSLNINRINREDNMIDQITVTFELKL